MRVVHVPYVIAVHGGAGRADPAEPGRAEARRRGLRDALAAGTLVLAAGGSALDAVVAAAVVLEDHPEFNAGRGSVLTAAGDVEMDASVMDGAGRRAGAVAVVRGIRNPVLAARAVLDRGRHVLLGGPAAEEFARSCGLRFEPEEWFVTPRRRAQFEVGPAAGGAGGAAGEGGSTIGAVALDASRHLAAATSTGGRAGQTPGRIGDSPVIGAGTWADDATCAVSGTGDGEAFLRAAFAHEVDARLRLGGAALDVACREALRVVGDLGGRGGCIAVDATGHVAMPFTTEVMFRGVAGSTGEVRIDEPAERAG